MIKIALYQPDIPQNVGAMIRLCACTGVELDVIEPCGFPWNDRKIKQSAMDYLTLVKVQRRASWQEFKQENKERRVVLMTTKTDTYYTDFEFQDGDVLLAGQESAGVPDYVHNEVYARVTIPMHPTARSLNIVNATSMILGEALRQTEWI